MWSSRDLVHWNFKGSALPGRPAWATGSAQLWAPEYPIPLGTLLSQEGETTYEGILVQQEQKAISDRGPGDIAKLLLSGETWKIG